MTRAPFDANVLLLVLLVDHLPADPPLPLRACCAAGLSALWLRAPGVDAALLREPAERLRKLTSDTGTALLISDHPGLVAQVGADAVHVGRRGPTVAQARAAGAHHVGVSCHSAASLAVAEAQGADYAFLSPVGAVPGKGRPLGIAGFHHLRASCALPVAGLGNVSVELAQGLRDAQAAGLVVRRAVFASDDPVAAVRALRRAWGAPK